MEILITLIAIALLAVLPVFCWRKSRPLAIPALLLYAAFSAIQWNFIRGVTGAWHDTQNWQTVFCIIKQWVDAGIPLGWNPYMSGGIPFSVSNNLTTVTSPFILAQLGVLFKLKFSSVVFFNLAFLAEFFFFCAGLLLVLQLLFGNNCASLLGFSALLFSDFFNLIVGQGTGIIVSLLLPYLFFFLIFSVMRKSWGALCFFGISLGIAANYYLPLYSVLATAAVATGMLLAFPKHLFAWGREVIVKKPFAPILAVALFLAAASPALFSYHEAADFVSPMRGYTQRGTVSAANMGTQASYNAPLVSYTSLFRRDNPQDGLEWIHQAFYIGVVPMLLFFLGLFSSWGAVFAATAALIIIAGEGFATPVWPWIHRHLPFFSLIRHTCSFAVIAALLLIIVAAAGCAVLLSPRVPARRKLLPIGLSGLLLVLLGVVPRYIPGALFAAGALATAAAAFLVKARSRIALALALCLVLLFHFADVVPAAINKRRGMRAAAGTGLAPLAYPTQWRSTNRVHRMPIDYDPILSKQMVWSGNDANQIVLMQQNFARFINTVGIFDRPVIGGNLFYLVPGPDAWKGDLASLARIVDVPLGFLCTANADSHNNTWEQPQMAIDSGYASYWHVRVPKETPISWISFSSPIPLSIAALRIFPRPGSAVQLWKDDHAELQVSEDGALWNAVQKLDMNAAGFDGTDKPIVFALHAPIVTRYLRIYIEDEGFLSFAELEIIPPADTSVGTGAPKEMLGRISETVSRDPNRLSVTVNARAPCYLLRMENFHAGWRVEVDGKKAPLLRVPANFQMVAIPQGTHTVTFAFRSPYPALLWLHTVTVAVGWIIAAVWLWRRRDPAR